MVLLGKLIDDYLGQSNSGIRPALVYRRTESGRLTTPRELEARMDQAYKREPKPNLRLWGRLTRIIRGTKIPTPSPSLLHPQPRAIDRAPFREPPSWRLDYQIGSGAYGTVFLENVQTREMESPELWAVKRIPQTLPNFTPKRYQAEIDNFELLARVSFARVCIILLPALASFNLSLVLSDI